MVTYYVAGVTPAANTFSAEPAGFVHPAKGTGGFRGIYQLAGANGALAGAFVIVNRFVGNRIQWTAAAGQWGTFSFPTNDAWPTVLPGTPG